MKKKTGKEPAGPKFAVHSLDWFVKKPTGAPVVSKDKQQEREAPKASIRNVRNPSNSVSKRGSSEERSQQRPRFKKLVRKNSSDEEEYVVPARVNKDSDDEDSEVEVAGTSRFVIGDIEQLKREEQMKKRKDKKIDEMIKKEKAEPKKEKKPSDKFSEDKKAELKMKASQLKKKKEKPKSEVPSDDRQLDSDEERQIRINRMKAKEDSDFAKAIALSKEQADLELALRKSKQEYENSARKTSANDGSAKKTEAQKVQPDDDDEDLELLDIYMRNLNAKPEKKEEQKPEAPAKKFKFAQEPKKPSKSKSKVGEGEKPEKADKGAVIYGPLTGKTFVMTGEFPEGRVKIEDMFRNLGAAVRGSVSKKTDYVIQGTHLDDGREPDTSGKSKKAMELGVKLIKYEDLDDLLVKLTDKTIAEHLNYKPVAPPPPRPISTKMETEEVNSFIPKAKDNQLWTEKYAPRCLADIVGQNAQIQNLREWLSTWERVHIQGKKHDVKYVFNPSPFAGGNINCKAALISGEPGIGKTSAAKLVCEELGYDFVEFNASDTRNKNSILGIEFNSMTLDKMGKSRKRVVIMDEVDGMSAGDRGGIAAIIQTIKKSRAPIICICNDRQHDKIKSLAGHCYDIKFFRPKNTLVVKRLMDILAGEGVSADEQSLLHIVESFNNDFRQILNYLDMTARTQQKLTYLDTKDSIKRNVKDTLNSLNKWQASLKLLNRVEFSRMTIRNRLDIFFTDTDMIPLMVEDSLVASMAKKSKYTTDDMRQLVKAYDSICQSDVLGRCIRMEQQWSLMPLQGFLSCIYPTEMVSNSLGATKFPEWLGKNSTTKKYTRQVRELRNAMSLVISGNGRAVAQDYCPAIVHMFIKAMEQQDIDGILDFMEEYRLTPELIKEHLLDVQFNPRKLDLMAAISTQTKAKLTKQYNKRHENSLKMKKSKQTAGGSDGGARYNDLLDEVVNESGDDQVEQGEGEQSNQSKNVEVQVKQSKKGKSKPKKK